MGYRFWNSEMEEVYGNSEGREMAWRIAIAFMVAALAMDARVVATQVHSYTDSCVSV
jgi:hypothetical protein